MPQSHKSIVGVRYNYLHFETHPESRVLATKETLNVAEIYGRFFPVKRVQVMAFVPYRFDEQATSAITKKNSGLGDRFGDQTYGTAELFRTFEIGKLSLMPSAGIYAEHSEHGRQNGAVLDITGGTIINGTFGLNLFAEKWMLGINGQALIHQKSASGHVFLRDRFQVQLGFLF